MWLRMRCCSSGGAHWGSMKRTASSSSSSSTRPTTSSLLRVHPPSSLLRVSSKRGEHKGKATFKPPVMASSCDHQQANRSASNHHAWSLRVNILQIQLYQVGHQAQVNSCSSPPS
jgi:hypothetical protein